MAWSSSRCSATVQQHRDAAAGAVAWAAQQHGGAAVGPVQAVSGARVQWARGSCFHNFRLHPTALAVHSLARHTAAQPPTPYATVHRAHTAQLGAQHAAHLHQIRLIYMRLYRSSRPLLSFSTPAPPTASMSVAGATSAGGSVSSVSSMPSSWLSLSSAGSSSGVTRVVTIPPVEGAAAVGLVHW